MSAQRILILVAVLIVVLYVISLAVASKNDGGSANPETSFFKKLDMHGGAGLAPSELNPQGGTWRSNQWTLAGNVPVATMDIAPSKAGHKIRRAKLTVMSGTIQRLDFKPREQKPGETMDDNAAPLRSKKLNAGDSLDLSVLEHGGTLTVTRVPTGACVLRFE